MYNCSEVSRAKMGLYFRKSKSYGPFRFNLSKSGVGVSTGVKGARLSFGPKGTYINVGRNGIYYKKKLGGSKSKSSGRRNTTRKKSINKSNGTAFDNKDTEFSTAPQQSIYRFQKSENNYLETNILQDIRASRLYFWLFTFISLLLCMKVSWYLFFIFLILYLIFKNFFCAHLNYNLSTGSSDIWEVFCQSFLRMKRSKKTWFIISSGYSFYYSMFREAVKIKIIKPFHNTKLRVRSNTISLLIAGKRHKFLFLPNCLIVKDGSSYFAYSYSNLRLESKNKEFLENETVQKDSQICDRTWKYTTKSGAPDLRYKNNPSIPICLYDCLKVYDSSTPVLEIWSSRSDVSEPVVANFEAYMNYFKEPETQASDTQIDLADEPTLNDTGNDTEIDIGSIADQIFTEDDKLMSELNKIVDDNDNVDELENCVHDNIEDIFDYLEEDDGNEL